MTQRIIYETQDGIAILIPSGEIAIEEVAKKDVPAGVDYWIVPTDTIPSDRTFRNAWEADLTALGTPHGQGIGADAWFALNPPKQVEVENDNS